MFGAVTGREGRVLLLDLSTSLSFLMRACNMLTVADSPIDCNGFRPWVTQMLRSFWIIGSCCSPSSCPWPTKVELGFQSSNVDQFREDTYTRTRVRQEAGRAVACGKQSRWRDDELSSCCRCLPSLATMIIAFGVGGGRWAPSKQRQLWGKLRRWGMAAV